MNLPGVDSMPCQQRRHRCLADQRTARQPVALQQRDRLQCPLVAGFRECDGTLALSRACSQLAEEIAHPPLAASVLAASRFKTEGATKPLMSPPRDAICRTSE